MPQDSVFFEIYNTTGDTIRAAFKDSAALQAWMDIPLRYRQHEKLQQVRENSGEAYWVMGVVFGLVLLITYLPAVMRWHWLRRVLLRNRRKEAGIAAFLEQNFLYYRMLPDAATKEKFARRVYQFQNSRRFHCSVIVPEYEARCLVSAAAVQLTFGLDNYFLWSFKDIHIQPRDYAHHYFDKPLEGHITHGNIYFSWRHFRAGFAVPDNMQNVGLHEMAHALAYECFNTGGGGDKHFKNYFYRYSAVARPIFHAMKEGKHTMLGDYACHNFDEFWAVSVEAFFEQPVRMRRELTELYEVMCRLLKQYPAIMQQEREMA